MSSVPKPILYHIDNTSDITTFFPPNVHICTIYNGFLPREYPTSDWIGVGYMYATKEFRQHYKEYLAGLKKLKDLKTDTYVSIGKEEYIITYFSNEGRVFPSQDIVIKCLNFVKKSKIDAKMFTDRAIKAKDKFGAEEINPILKEYKHHIFHDYPFFSRYEYNMDSQMFKSDIIHIEIDKEKFDDIIKNSFKIYPDTCIIPLDFDNLYVDLSAELGYGHLIPLDRHDVFQFKKNGKIQPFISQKFNKCLWCGGHIYKDNEHPDQIPGSKRNFCSDACQRQNTKFNNSLLEWLKKADIGYVKGKYIAYIMTHGFNCKIPELHGNLIEALDKEASLKNILIYYQTGQVPHKVFMSWLRGPCRECGKDIPLDKQMNAIYCSKECANKSKERKRRWYHKNLAKDVKKE